MDNIFIILNEYINFYFIIKRSFLGKLNNKKKMKEWTMNLWKKVVWSFILRRMEWQNDRIIPRKQLKRIKGQLKKKKER